MKKTALYLLLVTVALVSCEREKTFELSGPSLLVLFSGPAEIVQEPGNDVFLDFELQAASGLAEFRVLKDGAPFETIEFEHEISADYTFEYSIPRDEDVGKENVFTFELFDTENRRADYALKVIVRRTFSEIVETVNGTEVLVIKGRANSDYTLQADRTYVIDSVFSIENNSTLTIEAGTDVYFRTSTDPNRVSRIIVSRGARIYAEGTATDPIVFTSEKVLRGETPESTDWGGITMYGYAPTNQGSTVIDGGYRYGGNQTNDNSGTLRYVRIEYAGKDGLHALNMNGVGSNTRIEYVQVYQNENTAFRIRGGRVSLKYIGAIGHGGYGMWAEHGWQGNGQFWIFQTDRQATLVPVNFWNQARSLEFRNDQSNFTLTPRTQFRIANVTLIGNGYEANVNTGTRRGVRIRRGALGNIQNVLVTEFPDDAVRVEDLPISILGSEMVMDNLRSFNNRVDFSQEAESFFFESGDFNILNTSTSGVTLTDFVGSEVSYFNPASLGAYFSPAPYIGAVESTGNDWTSMGNWFKNLDGTIR